MTAATSTTATVSMACAAVRESGPSQSRRFFIIMLCYALLCFIWLAPTSHLGLMSSVITIHAHPPHTPSTRTPSTRTHSSTLVHIRPHSPIFTHAYLSHTPHTSCTLPHPSHPLIPPASHAYPPLLTAVRYPPPPINMDTADASSQSDDSADDAPPTKKRTATKGTTPTNVNPHPRCELCKQRKVSRPLLPLLSSLLPPIST